MHHTLSSVDHGSGSPPPTRPDPFRVNAMMFYTPSTLLPLSLLTILPGHMQKPSQEEDMIWSLLQELSHNMKSISVHETC